MRTILLTCLLSLLPVIYSCSGNSSSEDAVLTQTELYSLGFMPDTGLPIPEKAPQYMDDAVDYVFLAEKGLVLDSVIKMRTEPSYTETLPQHNSRQAKDWQFCNDTYRYIKQMNPTLWNRYIKDNNLPVKVYYWDFNENRLAIVARVVAGAERVIYGRFDKSEYFKH